jgi:hypothetical protein
MSTKREKCQLINKQIYWPAGKLATPKVFPFCSPNPNPIPSILAKELAK